MIKQVMPESYDKQADDGAGYTYTYDTQGRILEIYDPEKNRLHSYRYNGHGQILQEVDGEGKETLYRYNGLGQVERVQISVKKEDKRVSYRVIAYRYDRQGNKVEEAYGQEETAKDGEPQSWHRISFSYDGNNHLTKVQDEFGARMQYDYDCLGNLILEEQAIEEDIRRRIRYTYNKNGWRVKKEEEIQGNDPVRYAITRYEYDENGNPVRTLTPGGHETRCSYDANDRPVTERILDKRNGIDYQLHYTYDAAGNLLQKSVEGKQGESLKTSYRYDLKNRKTHEIGQSQGVTRYLYNQNDQLIKEIHPSGYELETDEGAGTTYRYDSRGNRTKTVNGLNQLVETNSYNLQNNPILRQDGLRNQTEIGYTLDGQMKEILRGTSQKHPIQQYTYNARGQITGITDGVGETTDYGLDGWGRITSIHFSDGVKEGYEYTPSGKVSKVTGGNGHSVQYLYNSLGKVRERIDQLGESETFQYDEEGNLTLYVDRDGNQTHRTYNVLGDVVYEKAVDKNGENPCITTYQYDSLGRLSKAVCNGHSYEYTYNEEGLLKEKRSSGKLLTSYEYDKAGKTTKMTDQAGVSTCYEYDILGRTTRLYTEQGMEVDYTYDCLNRIEQIGYGNGIITRYLYDENGNISTLETRGKENPLLSFAYTYDGNGNRTEKTGVQKLVNGSDQSVQTAYEYNVRGQLTKETQGEDTLHYTYDPSGNRIKKESKEGASFYGYNEKNQLICEEGIHGKRVFTYSRQGSILREESQSGTRQYAYNSRNQQIWVETEDKRIQENRYDADGLRFEMKENEKLLRFAYHKGELYFESSESSQTSYHLGAGIEGFTRDQKTSYLHQDEQLSTALVTDELGVVQNHYLYGAFGQERESAEQTPNRIRYTGQQYDGATGQYYLRARFYNPILGRFMQEDVYQEDGLNLYAYCDSNPVMYYDPSGYAKVGKYTCPPGTKFGNTEGGETIFPIERTHESARNTLMGLLDESGAYANGSKPNYGRLGASYGYEKQIGTQSLDGKVRWRLDYDPDKGVHYNFEDFSAGKKSNSVKIAIPIDISENEYKSIINDYNK